MPYTISDIAAASDALKAEFDKLEDKKAILRSPVMRDLVGKIKDVAPEDRKTFGQELNQLKTELSQWVSAATEIEAQKAPIDVTAPFDVNVPFDKKPSLLRADIGTSHPLMQELDYILDILHRLGFSSVESRQVDDDYHMFESLNFPEGHPARDDYDTFMTTNGLIAPAHTSQANGTNARTNYYSTNKHSATANYS
jgi:phenylalanyl-tRNA synthetase alpha chain